MDVLAHEYFGDTPLRRKSPPSLAQPFGEFADRFFLPLGPVPAAVRSIPRLC